MVGFGIILELFWYQDGAKVLPLDDVQGSHRPAPITGWDPRPRADHPPVWVKEGPEHYIKPKKAEITSLFKHAKAWLQREKNNLGEADTAIVYAWNECTEGGWLLPTKGEGRTRLEAVANALLGSEAGGHLKHNVLQYVI